MLEEVEIMLKPREELEKNLIEVIETSKLGTKKKIIKEIKSHLLENYEISSGKVQSIINDPATELPKLDIREIFLITEQIYVKYDELPMINPKNFFTDVEMKNSRQFSGLLEEKIIEFPVNFTHSTIVGNSAYMVTMDIQTIDKLIRSQNLHYNYDLQREATYKRQKETVTISPTTNKKNIEEITDHLLEGTLVPTVLVFNAATRSSESGTELIFDPKKMELTITKGTKLDIVDGYHRCLASQQALQTNPELHFNFAVLITNYSTKRAQQYQAQLAKATPISSTRIMELEANRLSDTIVQRLKSESELQGRISQTNRIHSLNKELVTYNVLSDAIDEQFELKTRIDAEDVADYLIEFFNFLLGSYPDEFLNKINETRENSLINDNNMFIGYIVLARRMFESDIRAKEIRKIIKNIDFSKENPIWQDSIVDDKGNLLETNKVRKVIKNYFDKLDIKVMV
jgi:hypothetical protein